MAWGSKDWDAWVKNQQQKALVHVADDGFVVRGYLAKTKDQRTLQAIERDTLVADFARLLEGTEPFDITGRM